jgi:hypothetical protein
MNEPEDPFSRENSAFSPEFPQEGFPAAFIF